MTHPLSPLLGKMPVEQFLKQYWQKKPCILRQVLSPKQLQILSVDELAGYALDENIESRLIIGKPSVDSEDSINLLHGPFSEEQLEQLPEQDWTLLIQSLDIWNDDYRALLDWISFLPRWRLDDIMVSIAAPGGGVGPHRDQYDVFLVQCQGQRQWQVSEPDDQADTTCMDELLQVSPFAGEIDQTFEPGDVLYLPPGWRHWGVAKSLSITCSIGFRAPSTEDLLYSLADQLADNDSERFTDPWRKANQSAAISADDIASLREKLSRILDDDITLAKTLGLIVTQPKFKLDDAQIQHTSSNIKARLEDFKSAGKLSFSLHPISRMTFTEQNGELKVFVNGETLPTNVPLSFKLTLERLCAHKMLQLEQQLSKKTNQKAMFQLISELAEVGAIEIH